MGKKPETSYAGVYFVLLLLLAVTVAAAFLHLGILSVIIALLIAAVQMTLLTLYFMDLRSSGHLNWIVAGASLLWLAILFALVIGDYGTRSWTG